MAVRIVIERAVANDGLKLTPNGFLSRADVKPVFNSLEWRVWSKEDFAAITKVINEHDVIPIQLVRITATNAGLLCRRGKLLLATKVGKTLLAEENAGELLARLAEA